MHRPAADAGEQGARPFNGERGFIRDVVSSSPCSCSSSHYYYYYVYYYLYFYLYVYYDFFYPPSIALRTHPAPLSLYKILFHFTALL